MDIHNKINLSQLLTEHKAIYPIQLKEALAKQKKSGKKLEKILIENGYIKEDKLLPLLATQLQVKWIDLKRYPFKTRYCAINYRNLYTAASCDCLKSHQ
jgi:MSHA biogenesis protein MshE